MPSELGGTDKEKREKKSLKNWLCSGVDEWEWGEPEGWWEGGEVELGWREKKRKEKKKMAWWELAGGGGLNLGWWPASGSLAAVA